MNRIFVDFEMHPISKDYFEQRQVWKYEIIEFGAVMLDEDGNEMDSFKSYVQPQFMKRYSGMIKDLTGISEESLLAASGFKTVLDKFVSWCCSKGQEFTVYAWSDSDLIQIMREMELKGIPCKGDDLDYTLSHWIDFQKEFTNLIGFDRPLSLKDALVYGGILPEGHLHDALWDARNTAELFRQVQNPEEYKDVISRIKEAMKPKKSLGSSLGELFDLGLLVFPEAV